MGHWDTSSRTGLRIKTGVSLFFPSGISPLANERKTSYSFVMEDATKRSFRDGDTNETE